MTRTQVTRLALAVAVTLVAARVAAAPTPHAEPDLSHLAPRGDHDWARFLESIVSGGWAEPDDAGLAALELRLARGAGPVNDHDLEALATMAGVEVLLVKDAPRRHDDNRPVGVYGPRTPVEFFLWLKVPLVCAGAADPSALGGPLVAAEPAGGALVELCRLWRRRGARLPSMAAARLVLADGDPMALRRALAAWIRDNWQTPMAELSPGGKGKSLRELYGERPRVYLPG